MAVYRQHAQGIWGSNVKEKQFKISLNSRKKLIEYFKGNKLVTDNLINAYTQIALSLILHYDELGNNDKIPTLKQEILHYNTDWDSSTLEQRLDSKRKEISSVSKLEIFSILKKCRKTISKILPLPRIKK